MSRPNRGFRAASVLAAAALATVLAFPAAAATAAPAPSTYKPYSRSMPGVLSAEVLGYSLEHRPIIAYRMGDPTSKIKGIILGQIHGEEHAGVVVTGKILRGPPVHGMDLWVIQTLNPDGDRVHRRQNDHGVDLNRNWPNSWAPLTGEHYSGPRPMSEPETRAMYNFVRAVKPNLMVSIHQPLDGIDTTDGGARNPAFRHRLSHNLGLPESAFVCNDVCHGSMTGWITHYQSGSAITVEFPYSPSNRELTQVAPRGILYAMNMRYGWSAAHNPRTHADSASAAAHVGYSQVTVRGQAFDPDMTSGRVAVSVTERSAARWHGVATGHGFTATFTAAAGARTYCVRVSNLGPGTGASVHCFRVKVPAATPKSTPTLTPTATATATAKPSTSAAPKPSSSAANPSTSPSFSPTMSALPTPSSATPSGFRSTGRSITRTRGLLIVHLRR